MGQLQAFLTSLVVANLGLYMVWQLPAGYKGYGIHATIFGVFAVHAYLRRPHDR